MIPLSPVRAAPLRRRLLAPLLGALLTLAAAAPTTAAPSGTAPAAPAARTAGGSAAGRAVADDSLRGAVATRLGERPPAGIDAAAWRRTVALYEHAGHAPRWVDGTGLRPRARLLVEALGRAHEHGLRRADYPLHALAAALAPLADAGPADAARLADVDVLLTGAFAAYAADMLTGRLDPRRIEAAWHIDANLVDVDSAMRRALDAERFDEALERLAPREDGYATLVRALARHRAIAARGGWPAVPEGPTLRPGDSAAAVPVLRERLRVAGHAVGADTSIRYDEALAAAVAGFQARHGLAVDSAVGPRTRAALAVPAASRARQIAANLERYRWLPPDLGRRRIVVNIPAFRLDAWDGERRALRMRVVVGRELVSRRTPVFSDSMSYVQFGPYWNVPRGIAVEEILPQARRDRGWLERNGYEIVRGWGDDAPVVSPWRLSDAELLSSRYRVRQRPGPDNALGRVKFIFPNDYAVYLHDTPAQSLFDERQRAYSHGCVRVADPAALARFVLAERPAWSAERIAAALATGERARVTLEEKIPVYLIYLTAFDQGGEVAFREDLYDLDAPVREALGAPADDPALESLVERLRGLAADA